jgi:sporulation protein YlmC with PRC-barrel domain
MILFVGFDLLDRQILDRDGQDVGKVDDVEFGYDDDGRPYVAALLVGQLALGRRLGGRLGGWMGAIAARLQPAGGRPEPIRIPYQLVSEVDSAVRLSVDHTQVAEPALETWLRKHLVERIPGAQDAGE